MKKKPFEVLIQNHSAKTNFYWDNNRLFLIGKWNLKNLTSFRSFIKKLSISGTKIIIDSSKLENLDTAGAWYIYKLFKYLESKKIAYELENMSMHYQGLLEMVIKQAQNTQSTERQKLVNPLERIGLATDEFLREALAWLYFIGEVFITFLNTLRHPARLRWNYLWVVLENNGYHALPIVGFLSFLIGVVLTYQIGIELQVYGANIFIINLLGLGIFREFAPLMTAIIITGRTGSAFTAQLGLMKSNEEIDALRTMGHSPTEFLIIPRIIGMMIIMPLLIVWSDIFGILGGMFMAKTQLGISYFDFLSRFPKAVTLTTFLIGMIKAPVFAMIIASVGCFHGFQVSGSSESIGSQTTKSVVMAIFMIIIADAIFSIILSWLGI